MSYESRTHTEPQNQKWTFVMIEPLPMQAVHVMATQPLLKDLQLWIDYRPLRQTVPLLNTLYHQDILPNV